MAYDSNGLFTNQAEKLRNICLARTGIEPAARFAEVQALRNKLKNLSKENYSNPRLFFEFLRSTADGLEIENLREINKIINPEPSKTGSEIRTAKRQFCQEFRDNVARASTIIDLEIALAMLCWGFKLDDATKFYEDHLVGLGVKFEKIERPENASSPTKTNPSKNKTADEAHELADYSSYYGNYPKRDDLYDSLNPDELQQFHLALKKCLSKKLTWLNVSSGQTQSDFSLVQLNYSADRASSSVELNSLRHEIWIGFKTLRLEIDTHGIEVKKLVWKAATAISAMANIATIAPNKMKNERAGRSGLKVVPNSQI